MAMRVVNATTFVGVGLLSSRSLTGPDTPWTYYDGPQRDSIALGNCGAVRHVNAARRGFLIRRRAIDGS